jgi:SAM-dependent MidA family methyltransferase
VAVDALAPAGLRERLALTAVEVAPRPSALPPSVRWVRDLPTDVVGLLIATEWLDNVPVDVVVDERYVTVSAGGHEAVDGPVDDADRAWLDAWWPAGPRREVGRARDAAWAGAVASVSRGLAVAVDYGHVAGARPVDGSLTGFRAGRQVAPVPDGSRDLTAHVAMDAVAAAPGLPYRLISQREALRALGVDGARPPLAMASDDPAGYVRALSRASAAAELTDPAGLGGHWWLLQPVGVDLQSVTRWTGSPVTREIAS